MHARCMFLVSHQLEKMIDVLLLHWLQSHPVLCYQQWTWWRYCPAVQRVQSEIWSDWALCDSGRVLQKTAAVEDLSALQLVSRRWQLSPSVRCRKVVVSGHLIGWKMIQFVPWVLQCGLDEEAGVYSRRCFAGLVDLAGLEWTLVQACLPSEIASSANWGAENRENETGSVAIFP